MDAKETESEEIEGTGSPKQRLSTGATLLNLALTDDPFGGLLPGKYYHWVGDSAAGKTLFSMTCMAEAYLNTFFRKYRKIYDNPEDGCIMDLDTLFNEEVADSIEPPAKKDGEPVYSSTVEEFYYHLDDANKVGEPFIYTLDSMDAIDSEAAQKKFEQTKKAYRKIQRGQDAEVAGSYGTDKAKKNSEGLRKVTQKLKDSGSILIIVSQTRDAVGSMFGGKTTAGGRALKFYATVEAWFSIVGRITKTVNEKSRLVGVTVEVEVKKNRITGKLHKVKIDVYPSHGIDDLGSCVNFLLEEKWWGQEKQGGKIDATEFGISATKEKLISHIEKKGLEDKLREVCGKCWRSIQEKAKINRKNRYSLE